MAFEKINDENKQHINLSATAMAVIENDMFSFNIKSRSSFLNTVINNYKEKADASISLASARQRNLYEDIFQDSSIDNKKEVIDLLIDDYVKNLKIKNNSYPKGVGIKFRIKNDNEEYLTGKKCNETGKKCNENQYYGNNNVGKYLKALLEEYCSKSYLEREKIFFNSDFIEIEEAIKLKKKIMVELNNGDIKKIKPFKILTDPLAMYHYLIGYSINENGCGSKMQSFSYRITNFKEVKKLEEDMSISSEDQKRLSNEINKKGVQFMCDEICKIKVYLTDEGIIKYNRMLHLRPPHDINDKGNIYTFHCTLKQIEYYFFKFGKDAKIISPENIKNKFKNMYIEAEKQYME